MYSLVKGYLTSRNSTSEQQSAGREEVAESGKQRRFSEPSNYDRSYLLWDSVIYVGAELKKGVDRGLQWITVPSPSDSAMSSKGKKQPEGTIEYTVGQNDTLAKISLQFNTLPTELTRLNKLPSHVMLFPGQTLFVPEKKEDSGKSTNDETVITKPPDLLLKSHYHNHKDKVNGGDANHEMAKIKLTKSVSLNLDYAEEDVMSEHYLKIIAKYITDGQGVVNGVMLVTPHSIMFNPDVSDPLVMDLGRDVYCISTPLSAITGAAIYNDIAAMAIHEPLKAGRFHVDAETAETLSRQNSSSTEISPPLTPAKRRPSATLDDIQEDHTTADDRMHSDKNMDDADLQDSRRATTCCVEKDPEDVQEVVKDILESLIEQISENTQSERNIKQQEFSESSTGKGSAPFSECQNGRMISPASEDSGISSPINRGGKTSNVETSDVYTDHLSKEQLCDESTADTSRDSVLDGKESNDESRQRAPSLLASLSNEVKYWFGGKDKRRADPESWSDEDLGLIPQPASSIGCQLRFLCVRISKKYWCTVSVIEKKQLTRTGEDLLNRDRRRREYWFAIPLDRIDQVYSFFQQWCPNFHKGSEDDSVDEDGENSPSCLLAENAEGEGISFNESFFSCTPPSHKVARAMSDSELLHRKPAKVLSAPKLDHGINENDLSTEPLGSFGDDVFEMDITSDIMTEKHLKLLNRKLPSRTIGHSWELVYSTFQHGFSLKTLYRKMEEYENPVLLVVLDDQHKVFGALTSSPLQLSEGFYGTGESFLFTFDVEGDITTFCWTGENTFFQKGSLDSLVFGSGGGNFGLWLDADLYHGSSHRCETYHNAMLSSTQDFLCSGVEVWTFV